MNVRLNTVDNAFQRGQVYNERLNAVKDAKQAEAETRRERFLADDERLKRGDETCSFSERPKALANRGMQTQSVGKGMYASYQRARPGASLEELLANLKDWAKRDKAQVLANPNKLTRESSCAKILILFFILLVAYFWRIYS